MFALLFHVLICFDFQNKVQLLMIPETDQNICNTIGGKKMIDFLTLERRINLKSVKKNWVM